MKYPVLSLVGTLTAMVVPMAGLYWWWQQREKDVASLEDILKTEQDVAGDDDPLELIKAEAWPNELPGMAAILAYDELKDELVGDDDDILLKPEEKQKLRHALMDRCQAHVAWLLRLEREQRSMERMSRRGMISASDYAVFSAFAEKLDVEVTEVREEAAWLCDDDTRSRQAADEIWRIAVQIWQQRRQAAASREAQEASAREAEVEQIKAKEKSDSLKAKVRAAQAKKSLKGLKGGFLDGGGGSSSKKNGKSSQKSSSEVKKKEIDEPKKAEFQASQWPDKLPNLRQKEVYEKFKTHAIEEYKRNNGAATVDEDDDDDNVIIPTLPESETKHRLRQTLMDRCQHLVSLLKALDQETERYRQAIDRARWADNVGAPKPEDWGRLERISQLAQDEKKLVEEEAEWLGDKDGAPGFGEKIWPMAFQIYQQLRSETEKQQKAATDNVVAAYSNHRAKPWPTSLPGKKHRDEYERLKAALLAALPTNARAAVLAGRPAPAIVGQQHARQLRQALMSRCQQTVPLIQRLQAEAKGVHIAASRGLVDDDELTAFHNIDKALKIEVETVKNEAEWLSDDAGNRRGMGDQVWPAAFQIYAKRRAEIAENLRLAQQQKQQPTITAAAPAPKSADNSDLPPTPSAEEID